MDRRQFIKGHRRHRRQRHARGLWQSRTPTDSVHPGRRNRCPAFASWKPSICPLCPAGCGVLVRVMEGEAEVIRNGQLGLIKMGLAKKLEGNPAHPDQSGQVVRARPGCHSGHLSSRSHYATDEEIRRAWFRTVPADHLGRRSGGTPVEPRWVGCRERSESHWHF